jgi:hypothetical protein
VDKEDYSLLLILSIDYTNKKYREVNQITARFAGKTLVNLARFYLCVKA